MRERNIEKYLREVVKNNGGRIYKFVSPGTAGVADDLVLLPSSFWLIETKRPDGRLAPLQEYFKKEVLKFAYINYATLYTKEQVDEWIAYAIRTRTISSRCN